jgi:DMSO/TMAO reductase YedYZ molybdopterin-dependent catalytic subunit
MTSVANAEWTLKVTDLTGNTQTLTYSQLLDMPKTTVTAGLYCYGLLVSEGEWGGVKLSDLLAQTNVDSTVGSILFFAEDGYSIIISLDTAMKPDTIIAYEKDGISLQETLRLVLPEANGSFWISMVTSMNLTVSVASENLSANYVRSIAPPTTPMPQSSHPQLQPTATPRSQPTVQPSTPPVSTNQPEQQQNTTKQNSRPQSQWMPIEVTYGLVIVFAAVAVVGFVIYRRKMLS